MTAKFIFITGGVVSSLGKGIAVASVATIFESYGLNVTMLKLNPYINVGPDAMSLFQCGEVFIIGDGAEADLDLGYYECFINATMIRRNGLSIGQAHENVIAKERRGDYLGGTVQVIPHITNEIRHRTHEDVAGYDVAIVEIGSTVNDIESLPFLEAIRQIHSQLGRNNTLFARLSYVPYIVATGEIRTKLTQHTVKEMLNVGLQPDILTCRTDRTMPADERRKIVSFRNAEERVIVGNYDVDSTYECSEMLHDQGIDSITTKQLQFNVRRADLTAWKKIIRVTKNPRHTVGTAVISKYVDLTESYKSPTRALKHADIRIETDMQITFVDSKNIEKSNGDVSMLKDMDAILAPSGFGLRGVEGKTVAVRYARENNVSYLGICPDMQIALIEYAHDIAGLKGASSTEFDLKCAAPIVTLINEWQTADDSVEARDESADLGDTMRLGARGVESKAGNLTAKIYGDKHIRERHRHRYEVNNNYVPALEQAGSAIGSVSAGRERLVETVGLPNHPWLSICRFHPEFTFNPRRGYPLFAVFVKAALNNKKV